MNADSEMKPSRHTIDELGFAMRQIPEGLILFEDSIAGSARYAFENRETACSYVRQRLNVISSLASLILNERESHIEVLQEKKLHIKLCYTHILLAELNDSEPLLINMSLTGRQINRPVIPA